jgi:hypothetical protein
MPTLFAQSSHHPAVLEAPMRQRRAREMITTPTVFVLGAGASIPYGFPSGNMLVDQICNASNPDEFAKYGVEEHTLQNFIKELRASRQGSVDAFLEHRTAYMEVGKVAIAYHLIGNEDESRLSPDREDWYTYLLDRMTEGTPFVDLGKNKIHFIAFNYDRSLEHYLHRTLMSRYGKSSCEVASVLRNFRILHVHGNLGNLPWQDVNKGGHVNKREYNADRSKEMVESAARGIKIISEHLDSSNEFGEAWDLLRDAKKIAILGFGYHPVNMKRLRLPLKRDDTTVVVGSCKGFTVTERKRLKLMYEGLRLPATEFGNLDFLRNEPTLYLD